MSQILKYRCSAILTALLSTGSLFLTIGSIATCNFVHASTVGVASSHLVNTVDSFEVGLFCPSNNYSHPSSRDTSFTIARAFVLVALFTSAIISIILWSVTLFITVSNFQWKAISIASAVVAFLHIPGFLIFDGHTCEQYDCRLDVGAYSLISSVVCMALVTVITQLCEAPTWIQNRDAWKVNQRRFDLYLCDSDTTNSDDDYYRFMSSFYSRKNTSLSPVSFFLSIFHPSNPRHVAMIDESVEDENDAFIHQHPIIDEFKGVQSYDSMLRKNTPFYAACDNSRLLLHVTPNGRQIGDEDRQSEWSFANSLDEDIRLSDMENGVMDGKDGRRSRSSSMASIRGDVKPGSSSYSHVPLQFIPSLQSVQSPVVYPLEHIETSDSSHSDQGDPEQSLLDPDVRIKGVGGHGILSPLHSSSQIVGKIISSSLNSANQLLRLKTDSSKQIDDGFSTSSGQFNESMLQAGEDSTENHPIQPSFDVSSSVNNKGANISEALPLWETFENVNEFQKAIDAGMNAANITNETEEDCTLSLLTHEENDSESVDSTNYVCDTADLHNHEMGEVQQIIIGVQELNKSYRRESAQKKRRKRKHRSSSSVSSRYSLLDLTIDEETKDDLELEDISGDDHSLNRSVHSGIRYKTSSSVSVYLPLNNSNQLHDDPLTAGLRLVSSVLSKMKDAANITDVGDNVGKTMEVSHFIYPVEKSLASLRGSDEESL